MLKLDENNHYGFAMTKPMPTGCIKKEPQPMWKTFSLLLQHVSLDDPVAHLSVVDISFDYEKATPRKRLCNEINPAIIGKQKIIDVTERSVYQLIEQYNEAGDGEPRSYHGTKKAHVNAFSKNISTVLSRTFVLLN